MQNMRFLWAVKERAEVLKIKLCVVIYDSSPYECLKLNEGKRRLISFSNILCPCEASTNVFLHARSVQSIIICSGCQVWENMCADVFMTMRLEQQAFCDFWVLLLPGTSCRPREPLLCCPPLHKPHLLMKMRYNITLFTSMDRYWSILMKKKWITELRKIMDMIFICVCVVFD